MSTISDLPASAEILVGPEARFDFAVDDGGQRHRITFKVPWEDSPEFLEVVKGYATPVGGITRVVPLEDPHVPGLYAVAITGRGKGSDANISAARPYPWLIYDVDFATLPYGTDGDSAYITLTHTGSSRTVTVPGQQYSFSNGSKIQADVGVPIGGVGIQLAIHQLPSLTSFIAAAQPLVGKVNSSPLTVAGVTYATGTVLFDTYSTQTIKGILGTDQTEAQVSLIYSALPWNRGIRPDNTWDDINPPPFLTGDLNNLIF